MTDVVASPLSLVQVAPARHVTVERYAMMSGETEKAVRRRIEDGVWTEGREYHRRHGRLFVDLEGVARWIVRGEK